MTVVGRRREDEGGRSPNGVTLRWGERHLVDVGGVPIHVETAGPADAPVVGLLHGFSSGTFTWAGVAPALVGSHRLVAWDRPPFGRSGRPRPVRGPRDPYRAEAAVAHGRAVLGSDAGSGPVVLVGHSAGALVAAQVAADAGVPVAGLILISAALDAGPPELVRRLFGAPGLAPVSAAGLRVALLGAAPVFRAVGRHRTPLLDATAAESARLLRRPGTATALVHLTRTWRPPDLPGAAGVPALPAVVIAGAEDRLASPTSQAALAEALGAELHLLPGVGHAPHEQVPDVVAPIIGAFVESVRR